MSVLGLPPLEIGHLEVFDLFVRRVLQRVPYVRLSDLVRITLGCWARCEFECGAPGVNTGVLCARLR